jgi:uncharacterized protein (DUF2236 family)
MGTTTSMGAVPDHLPVGRDSILWAVNAEPAALLGGGRALLMQVAHPGVGAGVEQHSTYADDPWGRLFRTVDVMLKLTFADAAESARQSRKLERMHRRVQGETELGERYSAFDVDLQIWVWATLVDTALLVYELVQRPLSSAERERYYAESKLTAYGCGAPVGSCPETWADFQAYIERVVASDLEVTRSARAVATATMTPPLPLPGPLAGVVADEHQLVTVGLMPPSLREQYGFEWDEDRQRRMEQRFRLYRFVSRLTPAPVRQLNSQIAVRRKKPLRIGWLQRRGAELTAQHLEAAGYA